MSSAIFNGVKFWCIAVGTTPVGCVAADAPMPLFLRHPGTDEQAPTRIIA